MHATLNGVTVRYGNAQGMTDGGSIRVKSASTLTLNDCVIIDNEASRNGGGLALVNSGATLIVNRTTIRDNAFGGYGGGIYNQGTATITSATISGNHGGQGGGIANDPGAHLTLQDSTLTSNAATGNGGGINNSGTSILSNSIVAGNTAGGSGPDVSNSITSGGYNLIGKSDGSAGWVASDKTGTIAVPLDAKLAALGAYGSQTQIYATLLGSPAIDAIPLGTNGCGSTVPNDQRDVVRPQGSSCDIGAFESRFTLTVSGGNNQSSLITQPFANPLTVTLTCSDPELPVDGSVITFTPPVTGASASLSRTTATVVGGTASVTATANDISGVYAVTATTVSAPPLSINLTNTPPIITVLSTSPQRAPLNTAFGTVLAVKVTNVAGVPVSGWTITFAAPASGASGSFVGGINTATTNGSGVATAPSFVANNIPGPYVVNATVTGATPASFAMVNIGPPARIIAGTGSTPQTTTVGASFEKTLTAIVEDSAGTPLPDVVVTFTTPLAGPSGSFGGGIHTATTNASGVATAAILTANGIPGGFTVYATVTGVTAPATFALTNAVALPAAIATTAGTAQTTPVGASFATPFAVTVTDTFGNPVPNAVVSFTTATNGPSGSFKGGANTATTNASGVASAPTFFANNIPGSYQVTATVNGLTTSFSLTNVAMPVPQGKPGDAPSGSAPSLDTRPTGASTGGVLPPPTGR